MFPSRSARPSVNTNGLVEAASRVVVPAVIDGANGATAGQLLPGPSQSTVKKSDGSATAVKGSAHELTCPSLVAGPHACGLAKGARAPLVIATVKLLSGNCGFSLKTAVI